MDEKQLTFLGHLEDLRRVLIRSFVALAVGFALCLAFSPQLFAWLKAPMQRFLPEGSHFIVTTPFETYYAYFKISLVFGFFIATPVIFYFFWSFVHPGLTREEKRGVVPVALSCAALFVGGALFGYFLVFPTGFAFAIKILDSTDILMLPKMSDYLSLAIRLLLAFGIIFELPLFLALLGRFRLVRSATLRRIRKYVIVLIFLVAGVLTPGPDVLSQVLMAVPLLVLFELGIGLVWLRERQTARAQLVSQDTEK